ncbi:MAG: 7-cyano-7-deazaguanine synthase [Planctomycetota bacterium]
MAVRPDTLILSAGGLGSLVALSMDRAERERETSEGGKRKAKLPGLVYVHDGREAGRPRLEHARQMADFFGIPAVLELAIPHLHGPAAGLAPLRGADGASNSPIAAPQVLLAALDLAQRLEATRLVWPVHCGGDAGRLALAMEQVALVQHLREACRSSETYAQDSQRDIELDTPLLELSTPQMLDLGQRVDASWGLAWSCLLPGAKPCGACAGCRQRRRDFDAAGLVDPLEPNARADRKRDRGGSRGASVA